MEGQIIEVLLYCDMCIMSFFSTVISKPPHVQLCMWVIVTCIIDAGNYIKCFASFSNYSVAWNCLQVCTDIIN